jgi:micrococcal nuclease
MLRRELKKNKSMLVFFLIAVGAVIAGLLNHRRPGPSPSEEKAAPAMAGEGCVLMHVVDGDTVRVRFDGRDESVRMLRINTPERDQRGYAEARDALRELLAGRELRLAFEVPRRLERDKYGRVLAYVLVDDVNANVEMVRQGWSRFWTRYGRGRLGREFETAEREARQQTAGLWSNRGWNR